jgi:dynein heavy chain
MLPLPHAAKHNKDIDKSILHTLETAVIDWTHQIKEVIKSDSSAPLEEGLNPGPMVEIDFWTAKAANLTSIHQQLTDPKIQMISDALQRSNSSYYPAMRMIFEEVEFGMDYLNVALQEANDISTYLKALRPRIEAIEGVNEFIELAQIFPGLMKTLLMIWKCSNHYKSPSRLCVILQEICNDIIEAARNHIQPAEIFTVEAEEASEKLKTVLKVCDAFKKSFFDGKSQLAKSAHPWNFDVKLVFSRLDKFINRVSDILALFDTIMEFQRLEKIEIGGTKVLD